MNCVFHWLKLDWDDEKQTPVTRENVEIDVEDFGGVSGFGSTVRVFGMEVMGYFKTIIQDLQKRGYIEGIDLFGAPYDWRFGLAQPEYHWNRFKSLVEMVFEKNKAPVTLMTHSLGAQITHYFLTNKTTPEWRKKYIDHVIHIAPSWSGTGAAIGALWWGQAGLLGKLTRLKQMLRSLGTLHVHMPHMLAYENETVFVDEAGVTYGPESLLQVLKAHGKLDEKSVMMAESNAKFGQAWPQPPDFRTSILYNSGVRTVMGVNASRWSVGVPIFKPGDGLVGSKVIDWACANWNDVHCVDMNSSRLRYWHKQMIWTQLTRDIALNMALGNTSSHQTMSDEL